MIHLGRAFKNVFAGIAEYPTLKKKGRYDHFTLTNDPFAIKGSRGNTPKLGWVPMHEPLRFMGKVIEGIVSQIAGS